MVESNSDSSEPCGPVSAELLAELRAVAALPDEQINTDDLPEVTDWSGAVRGRFYKPAEHSVGVEGRHPPESRAVSWSP